jgi:hypothetical protein
VELVVLASSEPIFEIARHKVQKGIILEVSRL